MTVDTRAANSHAKEAGATGDDVAGLTRPLSHPRLVAIPAFADNYIWAVTSPDGSRCLVVDPGDADPVARWLHDNHCMLAAILVTHHHADHVGGLQALRAPGVRVYGPRREAIAGIDVAVGDGDVVRIPELALTFSVLDVPGHTRGHIAFTTVLHDSGQDTPLLFCGDTLFSAGCGRLFEGTAEDMHASLSRLAALPPDTLVCCAHEYTLGNLRFAAQVEPGNADIATITRWARAQRDTGRPTLPSSIARELHINPFLRTQEPAVIGAALQQGGDNGSPAAVFAALRRWKDGFR